MKKIIIGLLMLPFFGISQTDSSFEFKFIDSSTATKNELYTKAKIWITDAFKSAKDVIQMDDKDAGRIVARGVFQSPVKGMWGTPLYDYINFKITIDVKDNKYRIALTDFVHEKGTYRDAVSGGDMSKEKPACGTLFMSKKKFATIKEEAKKTALQLTKDFSIVMKKSLPKDDF